MNGKRILTIVGFGILVAGCLTALWLMTLPMQRGATSQAFAEQRAEKERHRNEVIQQVAFKQQRLEERQLAEAQRLAQGHDDEQRRLADTVRALEKERLRQTEFVQASLKHRQDAEFKAAEARRLAEEERVTATARQRQLEENRRLSEAIYQLERERVRQAEVVQASMTLRSDIGAEQAAPKSAKYNVASGKAPKVGRSQKCTKACPSASPRNRATTVRHARRQAPADGLAYLCPWRWLETVIAELIGPVGIAERANARRFS